MNRRAGILLHPLSLPGSSGGGTLGRSVATFLEFCKAHHQAVWQVLPLGPTGYGDSPYQSFSTHAGNPYLIDLATLQEQGLATKEEVEKARIEAPSDRIDYCQLYEVRRPVLYAIARQFEKRADKDQLASYRKFCKEQKTWLDDYALYSAIKEEQQKSWQDWPEPLRLREPKALKEYEKKHKESVRAEKVVQWFFDEQWQEVRRRAKEAGVEILGDMPIFVALDSADSWANPELFLFDDKGRPTSVAGVPPDYFSADGQLWGNPLYDWKAHEKTKFAWWKQRLASALRLYDQVRIDHFRGFAAFWQVPAGAETARDGKWVEAPGVELFKALRRKFPEMPVVAEDLGDITPDVYELRDRFDLPGMKVLQFAFSDPSNDFLPHNFGSNFVVYTGTHDNDTCAGWYEDENFPAEQHFFRRYLGLKKDVETVTAVHHMVRLALRSVAGLAVIPFQDILALGTEARMNTPSEGEGNWQWRMTSQQLETEQPWYREATWLTRRAP